MSKRERSLTSSLERIAIKLLSEDERLNLMLSEGRVSYLIVEALDNSDVAALKDALKQTKDELEGIMKKLAEKGKDTPMGLDLQKIADISQYLKALDAALDKAEKTVAELDLEGDPEGWRQLGRKYFGQESDAQGVTRAVVAVQGRAAQFSDALKAGIERVVRALSGLKGLVPDEAIRPQAGKGTIPDVDKIKAALNKAFEQGAPKKGFLSKAMDYFKGQAGLEDKTLEDLVDPDFEALADALMDKSFNELKTISDTLSGMGPGPTTPQDTVQDVTAPSPDAGAAAAGKPEKGLTPEETAAADAEAESVADELGSGPISKKELTAILKSRSFSELGGEGGKATRHRRIFRKAINQAAGKAVFEERLNVMRKRTNLPRLAEVLLPARSPRLKLQRQGQRLGLQKPRDHEVVSERWLELAGLEER